MRNYEIRKRAAANVYTINPLLVIRMIIFGIICHFVVAVAVAIAGVAVLCTAASNQRMNSAV